MIEFTGEHSTLPFQILSRKAKKISIFSLTIPIPLGFPVTFWKLWLFSKQSGGDYDGGDNGEEEKKEEGDWKGKKMRSHGTIKSVLKWNVGTRNCILIFTTNLQPDLETS